MFEQIYVVLRDNPVIGFLTLSIVLNVYLFKLLLNFNDKYINLLKENGNITKQMNIFLQRFQLKPPIEDKDDNS